ncbi:MAG: hypothetical protein HWN65_12800 [Candidatus Helarchaeota archaeon]|nr:hypothetical protein [Candidatus Helarchaeota archaeon]
MPKATKKRRISKKTSKKYKRDLTDYTSSEKPASKEQPKKASKKKIDQRLMKIHSFKDKKAIKQKGSVEKIPIAKNIIQVDEASTQETYERIHNTSQSLLKQIMETGKPSFEIPSRSSTNIIWDEVRDLLLLGEKITKRPFHSLASVVDSTRLMRVIEIVNELLLKNIHAEKREIFYADVNLFKEQKNSDKSIEDLSTMLKIVRNSTHIVANARGTCIGRLKIRDSGDDIDLERLGRGGWAISPFLDEVEIIESDAEFILVVEKDAALNRISEVKWWEEYPCIVISGKGAATMATRMFLRRLSKELVLPCFCLVDSDPYGHYIYSVYLRGSKRLSYESPFLATPGLHLLGVLSRDLEQYKIPDSCLLNMNTEDIKRVNQMLEEPFVQKNINWVKDLQLMLDTKQKAEIQAFIAHGFEYLTENYLPTKLSTGDWI